MPGVPAPKQEEWTARQLTANVIAMFTRSPLGLKITDLKDAGECVKRDKGAYQEEDGLGGSGSRGGPQGAGFMNVLHSMIVTIQDEHRGAAGPEHKPHTLHQGNSAMLPAVTLWLCQDKQHNSIQNLPNMSWLRCCIFYSCTEEYSSSKCVHNAAQLYGGAKVHGSFHFNLCPPGVIRADSNDWKTLKRHMVQWIQTCPPCEDRKAPCIQNS